MFESRLQQNNKKKGRFSVFFVFIFLMIIIIFGARHQINDYVQQILIPSDEKIKLALKEIIEAEPEIIVDAFKAAKIKEINDIQDKIKSKIKEFKNELEDSKFLPQAGNPNGKVQIIYFFDYNCGYCKKASLILNDILRNNPEVKILFKELPILGDKSVKYAKAALAVYQINKDKYPVFHDHLMSAKNNSEINIDELVKSFGIDLVEFNKLLEDKAIDSELDKISNIAQKIGIGGTPAIIVGDEFIPGVDENQINSIIKNILTDKK